MARYLLLLLGSASAFIASAFVTPTTRVRDTTLHAVEAEEIGDAIALQAFRALDAVVDGGFAAGDVLQNKVAPALAQGGDAAAETLKTKVLPALADGAEAFQTNVVPAVGDAIITGAAGAGDAFYASLQAARDENLYEEKMRDILAAHNGANGLATSSAVMSAINYVPPAQVNIKGERHSGTHFLMAMMQHLYGEGSRIKPGVCPNSGGCPFCGNCATCDHTASVKEPSNTTYCCWRHGYADAQCAGFKSESYPLHLFVVRSPYPWLLAMHAQPYEYEGNYSVNRSVHPAARTVHGSHCTPCSQCAPHTEIAAPRVGAAATGPSPTSSAPSLPTSRSRTAATTRVARAR